MKLFETQQETKPKIEFFGWVYCAIGTIILIAYTANSPVIPYIASAPLGMFCAYAHGTLKGDPA